MEYLKVKNLEKYQNLSKTKYYATLDFGILDDHKIFQLTNGERWVFVACIILGAKTCNKIPYDTSYIHERVSFKCRNGARNTAKCILKLQKLQLLCLTDGTEREIEREKDRDILFNLKDLISYKEGRNVGFKPTYLGDDMRWVKAEQKWYVIVKGEWLKFADPESKILWVKK